MKENIDPCDCDDDIDTDFYHDNGRPKDIVNLDPINESNNASQTVQEKSQKLNYHVESLNLKEVRDDNNSNGDIDYNNNYMEEEEYENIDDYEDDKDNTNEKNNDSNIKNIERYEKILNFINSLDRNTIDIDGYTIATEDALFRYDPRLHPLNKKYNKKKHLPDEIKENIKNVLFPFPFNKEMLFGIRQRDPYYFCSLCNPSIFLTGNDFQSHCMECHKDRYEEFRPYYSEEKFNEEMLKIANDQKLDNEIKKELKINVEDKDNNEKLIMEFKLKKIDIYENLINSGSIDQILKKCKLHKNKKVEIKSNIKKNLLMIKVFEHINKLNEFLDLLKTSDFTEAYTNDNKFHFDILTYINNEIHINKKIDLINPNMGNDNNSNNKNKFLNRKRYPIQNIENQFKISNNSNDNKMHNGVKKGIKDKKK